MAPRMLFRNRALKRPNDLEEAEHAIRTYSYNLSQAELLIALQRQAGEPFDHLIDERDNAMTSLIASHVRAARYGGTVDETMTDAQVRSDPFFLLSLPPHVLDGLRS